MDPIRAGDTGPAVSDVQARLRAAGVAVDDEEGYFGPPTLAAVRRFQQGRGLVADGMVGDDTWAALTDATFAFGDRLLYETRPPLRGDDVLELQQRLGRLGFDVGPADGILGARTAGALREFQHNCGVAVDGIVGATTIARLDSLRRDHQAASTFEVLERVAGSDARPLAGARILVDPAHGPDAPGVVVGDAVEERIVMDVGRRLAAQLLALGAVPLLSRGPTTTPSATERAAFANEADVACIVSLRCSGLEQYSARGVAGYYFGSTRGTSERGRALATHAVRSLSQRLGTPDCRVHPSTTAVLRESRPPAALVELGFLSNEVEGAALQRADYRHAAAAALAEALQAWFAGEALEEDRAA